MKVRNDLLCQKFSQLNIFKNNSSKNTVRARDIYKENAKFDKKEAFKDSKSKK